MHIITHADLAEHAQRRLDEVPDDSVNDPLHILIAAEEELEFDGGCSFPQCYRPCANCTKQ